MRPPRVLAPSGSSALFIAAFVTSCAAEPGEALRLAPPPPAAESVPADSPIRSDAALDHRWVEPTRPSARVVVLLHGYGAPGDDLVPLAESLSAGASVRVLLPVAPLARPQGGRAWWPIDHGPRPSDRGRETPEGVVAARQRLVSLLEQLRRQGTIEPAETYLAGFSQGAMLAQDVALEWNATVAGVVMLSGGPIDEERWRRRLTSRAPVRVFVSHGRSDRVLAFAAAQRWRQRLEVAGSDVTFAPFDGGHQIPRPVVTHLIRWLGG